MSQPVLAGTVTFLMSDVEGSTALWEADPDLMRAAMDLHDRIIGQQVASNGGSVVKPRGEGDSQFCVFESPRDALIAAVDIQRALAAQDWPTRTPIAVRIAVYAGAAASHPREADYYGPAPNRCARIRDLGHGGQVLVSSSTAAMVSSLPEKVALDALGSYRLRGIDLPEPVYQLVHPDLSTDFPPLRAPAPGYLPEPLTSFIGRASEIEELATLMEERRLITLTGAAGVGKTRLGLELARTVRSRYPNGTWFVDLAPVADPAQVARTLIGVFGLLEERGRSVGDVLEDFLRDKDLVIVLDNCEHLVAACAALCAQILVASPGCHVIATSREPLGAAGEVTWRVASLSVPETEDLAPDLLSSFSAPALFAARARDADASFRLDETGVAAVARICRRLDGIPLAIELAAGKVGVLNVAAIATKVEDRFELVTGGPRTAMERQQTMRAAIDWSYELLSDAEQALLCRLAVFVGGFSSDAARAICSTPQVHPHAVDELIASLVRKSLVAKDVSHGRYRLLETIRAYAREKLASSGLAPDVRRAHLSFFRALGAEATEPLKGGGEQRRWLDEIERDHDNVIVALRFATGTDPPAGLALAIDILPYLMIRGYRQLGRTVFEQLLDASGAEITSIRAGALCACGLLTFMLGDYDRARARLEESLSIARELRDQGRIAWAAEGLAQLAVEQGEYEAGRAGYDESLAIWHQLGDRRQVMRAMEGVGSLAYFQGDHDEARANHEGSLAIARELGDRTHEAWAITALGNIANDEGDYDAARAAYEGSLAIARELGDRGQIATGLGELGGLAYDLGDYDAGRAAFEESLTIVRELGDRRSVSRAVACLGLIDCRQGGPENALARFQESLSIAREMGDRRAIFGVLLIMAELTHDLGDLAAARARLRESFPIAREVGPTAIESCLRGIAILAATEGSHETACVLTSVAAAMRERLGLRLGVFDQSRADQLVKSLREASGQAKFDEAWARGKLLDIGEAITLTERYLES